MSEKAMTEHQHQLLVQIEQLQLVNEGLREAVTACAQKLTEKERDIKHLLGTHEVARDAAKILRTGLQADAKNFSITYEEYPYSDTFDPDDDDHGENEDVGTLISFLNSFGGSEDKIISHYRKDPEEQETLARQSAHYGW